MKITKDHIPEVLHKGNWIVRTDNNGKSYNGFELAPVGEWTEAPDWNTEPVCWGGLFGQDKDYNGYCKPGNRLLFCETYGEHIPIGGDKVKVRYVRPLLVNELPGYLGENFPGSISLSAGASFIDNTPLGIGGGLSLCSNVSLTANALTSIGGSLYLSAGSSLIANALTRIGGDLCMFWDTSLTATALTRIVGVRFLSVGARLTANALRH